MSRRRKQQEPVHPVVAIVVLGAFGILALALVAGRGCGAGGGATHVNGYTRSNGTHVNGYERH